MPRLPPRRSLASSTDAPRSKIPAGVPWSRTSEPIRLSHAAQMLGHTIGSEYSRRLGARSVRRSRSRTCWHDLRRLEFPSYWSWRHYKKRTPVTQYLIIISDALIQSQNLVRCLDCNLHEEGRLVRRNGNGEGSHRARRSPDSRGAPEGAQFGNCLRRISFDRERQPPPCPPLRHLGYLTVAAKLTD